MTNEANLTPTGVLIWSLVTALVDHPQEVTISERIDADRTVISVDVPESDVGKIIGKSGRTARSIRTILNCAGLKIGRRFDLLIVDRKRAESDTPSDEITAFETNQSQAALLQQV